MDMVIQKILNNNVVVSEEGNAKEVIVMGLGIAFGKRIGDLIPEEKIDKIFHLEPSMNRTMALEVLEAVPLDILKLSASIINYAKEAYRKKLNDIIYITLADHIMGALTRHGEGIQLANALIWDIKHFYPEEFKIGMYAIEQISEAKGISLLEDEAGFIAYHFVNAQMESAVDNVVELTLVMQEITNIIKYYFQVELDENSVHYFRYINHLKFFAHRLLSQTSFESQEDTELTDLIKRKYQNAFASAQHVAQFIEKKYHYTVSSEEVVYLTIHIQKLIYN